MDDRGDPLQALSVVLHDVSPSTWPAYAGFVKQLDDFGASPLTLLVVPDYHHQCRAENSAGFCSAIHARLSRGDEVALHGYYHDDTGPLPLRPRDYFVRRFYTREGEFYSLIRAEARARIELGLNMFHRLQWPVLGFVAPAWLMSDGTREALTEFPFKYTSNPGELIRLPEFKPLDAPTLVWSARSAWRRWISQTWNNHRLQHSADAALIRLGLHPIDMRYPSVVNYWLCTLQSLLSHRRLQTKSQWLGLSQ